MRVASAVLRGDNLREMLRFLAPAPLGAPSALSPRDRTHALCFGSKKMTLMQDTRDGAGSLCNGNPQLLRRSASNHVAFFHVTCETNQKVRVRRRFSLAK